jgi:hypothetical protein
MNVKRPTGAACPARRVAPRRAAVRPVLLVALALLEQQL